jgi:hypothetical protein
MAKYCQEKGEHFRPMTHTTQLFLITIIVLPLGMLIDYILLTRTFRQRTKIANKKIVELMNGLHKQEHTNNFILQEELKDLKIWAADAEVYIQELELENLALNGTKSRATITLPEDEGHTKETKKVVRKRTRKA